MAALTPARELGNAIATDSTKMCKNGKVIKSKFMKIDINSDVINLGYYPAVDVVANKGGSWYNNSSNGILQNFSVMLVLNHLRYVHMDSNRLINAIKSRKRRLYRKSYLILISQRTIIFFQYINFKYEKYFKQIVNMINGFSWKCDFRVLLILFLIWNVDCIPKN